MTERRAVQGMGRHEAPTSGRCAKEARAHESAEPQGGEYAEADDSRRKARCANTDSAGVERSTPPDHAAAGTADDPQLSLRVWLRLLRAAGELENAVRRKLRLHFDLSLSRFDYLSQLDRYPEGLPLSALSRHLMVTGGNVTGLTRELEALDLIARHVVAHDRRSSRVTLTLKGQRLFERAASAHAAWINDYLADVPLADQEALYRLLGGLRNHVVARQRDGETAGPDS